MEAAIVSALVAAFVSLMGILVNIHIARKSRIAAENNLRVQYSLDRVAKEETYILDFISHGEKLRIRCWDLMGQISFLLDDEDIDDKLSDFITSFNLFFTQSDTFLDSWANVKAVIPKGATNHFRIVRHECRTLLITIDAQCKILINLTKDDAEQSVIVEQAKKIRESLDSVNKKLDNLLNMASSFRTQLLVTTS